MRLIKVFQMVFVGVWFRMNQMLGDTIEAALNKMMMTDQHQHNDGLLQEFYAMTSTLCISIWQSTR